MNKIERQQKDFFASILAAIGNLNDSVSEIQKARSSKSDNEEKKKVMYGNKDLVGVYASKQNLYVRALMKQLFTPNELRNGIIVENENGTPTRASERIPLDITRINKLKGSEYYL